MSSYIKVCEDEDEESIGVPCETDYTLLLSTLCSNFPGATGLKYKADNTFRGVRLVDGKFYPPESGWEDITYYCVFPKENKRKCDESISTSNVKAKRFEKNICTDLIVLGLPWKVTDTELKEYFEIFGDVVMAMVKKDPQTGHSKGFGFIRFENYESQVNVLSKRHLIDGRWCDVKIPNSKEGPTNRVPCKIFIGRLPVGVTVEDLREYFSQFGKITDVYIPKPFRFFAFVTFESPEIAQTLYGGNHIINGVSVHISEASPRRESSARSIDHSTNNNEMKTGDNTAAFLKAIGVNPAVVAALNQAGWNNLSNPGSSSNNPSDFSGSFPNSPYHNGSNRPHASTSGNFACWTPQTNWHYPSPSPRR